MVANRDLVVVGASAGGVEALRELVSGLPADLDAAVLVVLHLPPGGATALDSILDRCGPLPCAPAEDGAPLRRGTVVVGRPDRHLRVVGDRIVLDRGPSEGGHRPSVDALFRSAARARGPRTTGVVLSGVLDDGAAGLVGIARAGGRVVLQDPADALHPGMPHGALRLLVPDHVSPARDIGPLLGRIAREPAEPVLPDTGGTTDELDRALWAAYRVLNDRAALAARLEGATDHTMSTRHGDARREAELLAGELRTLLLGGLPAGRAAPAGDGTRAGG